MSLQVQQATAVRRRRSSARRNQAPAMVQIALPAAPSPVAPMQSAAHLRRTTLTQAEPDKPAASPEYDPFEIGGYAQDVASGVAREFLAPPMRRLVEQYLTPERFPWLGSPYGQIAVARSAGVATGTAAGVVAGSVAWGVRSALHGLFPNVAAAPGLFNIDLPPANKLAGSWARSIITEMGKRRLADILRPQPPKPMAPPPLPADAPSGARVVSGWLVVDPAQGVANSWAKQTSAPQVLPPPVPRKPGPVFNGQDIKQVAVESLEGTAVSMLIGAAYSQTVGPVVQKAINVVMGRGDEPISKPAPMTPGGFVNAAGGAFLGTMLMKPAVWKGPGTGLGPALATSLVNGMVSAAIDSVYSRGLGGAVEDAINGWVGLPTSGRKPETAGVERVLRTTARGAVSTGAAFWLHGASQALFQGLAVQIGGPLGAIVGMAGPHLTALVGGSVVDALVGAQVGQLAGSAYEWVTGKPRSENRPVVMDKPGGAIAAGANSASVAGGSAAAAAPTAATKRARRRSQQQGQRLAAIVVASR